MHWLEKKLKGEFYQKWELVGGYTHFTNGIILRIMAWSKSHRLNVVSRLLVSSVLITMLYLESAVPIYGIASLRAKIAPMVSGPFTVALAVSRGFVDWVKSNRSM